MKIIQNNFLQLLLSGISLKKHKNILFIIMLSDCFSYGQILYV